MKNPVGILASIKQYKKEMYERKKCMKETQKERKQNVTTAKIGKKT